MELEKQLESDLIQNNSGEFRFNSKSLFHLINTTAIGLFTYVLLEKYGVEPVPDYYQKMINAFIGLGPSLLYTDLFGQHNNTM